MAATKSTLVWSEIDPASLSEKQQEAYADYKAAYAVMKQHRVAFEQSMQVHAPAGSRIVCGYNFGKLSVALAPDDAKPVKQAKGSLADFIASQQAGGRRA